jgi:thiosulfate/3-mercaptopyruvate sulfurtransferase
LYTTLVDHATLRWHLDDAGWLIVDCRFSLADVDYGARAYAEGHIPGAHYLHLDHDLSSPITPVTGRHPLPDIGELAAKLSRIGLGPEVQVVAYDDCGGAMAVRVWWLLRWLGHPAVALLDGGFQAWVEHGGELQQAVPQGRPGHFVPRPQPGFIADTAEIAASLARSDAGTADAGAALLLVDARTAIRFRGESEPIDPVAGRIPGALNRPLADNLAGGYFKSPAQLRAEWTALLANEAHAGVGIGPAAATEIARADAASSSPAASEAHPPAVAAGRAIPSGADLHQVVHYCGSGVTAVHNQLAMEIAGLAGSRLYPGSWSEWIRDARRPVAVGA